MQGPSPDTAYPMPAFPQVCYLKNIITQPNIAIGDFTYYDDPDGAAIVAARSVVVADVAPYTVVGGNPARPVRERFDAEAVQRLLAIAWWDRPVEWIGAHLPLIRAGDVSALARAV